MYQEKCRSEYRCCLKTETRRDNDEKQEEHKEYIQTPDGK